MILEMRTLRSHILHIQFPVCGWESGFRNLDCQMLDEQMQVRHEEIPQKDFQTAYYGVQIVLITPNMCFVQQVECYVYIRPQPGII